MKHSQISMIRSEIATFADDVDEIVFDANGVISFERLGKIVEIQLVEEADRIVVHYNGNKYAYKDFLAKELAHLDLFAKKILQKDNPDEEIYYVDPDAMLVKLNESSTGHARDLLREECDQPAWLGSRVVFVTADAGHGKSFLLRQFQREQAKKYLNGNSKYFFWHIDLHGRELVRLNEAIMYELGDLRITGLYYNSIITLIRNGLIILGIDGFDELAAEKGGDVALGSLRNLVMELAGDGILVAASRRTFFNTQDYIQRAGMINQKVSADCEFDEIRLKNWQERQCIDYLNVYYSNGALEYSRLKDLFKSSESHPLLERPFLFTKIVSFAEKDGLTPREFVTRSNDGNNLDSINNIIGSFVRREVTKWSTTSKETGKPYLTYEQHLRLLDEVAGEMWLEQKDNISIETIQFILAILFDEWHTEQALRPMINRMAESHALLPASSVGDHYRKFDHEEFRNYFLALSFSRILKKCIRTDNFSSAYSFLKIAQLPDTVSQYLILQLNCTEAALVLDGLKKISKDEMKVTYANPNIGTIIPYLIDKIRPQTETVIGERIVFSSLVFENKTINNVKFCSCSFINISFNNSIFENVVFDKCTFSDIRFDNIKKGNSFQNVVIKDNCEVSKVTIIVSEEDKFSEYSPCNINGLLLEQGIRRTESLKDDPKDAPYVNHSNFRKVIKRFLNKYTTTAYLYEKNIKVDPIYNSRKKNVVFDEVIPLLERYDIIEEVETHQTHQSNTRAWRLKNYSVQDIYMAEENKASLLYGFWKEVNDHD